MANSQNACIGLADGRGREKILEISGYVGVDILHKASKLTLRLRPARGLRGLTIPQSHQESTG